MKGVPCFWLAPNDLERRSLRIYSSDHRCGRGEGHYCEALVPLDTVPVQWTETGGRRYHKWVDWRDVAAIDDPRWPTACTACGKPFHPKRMERQLFAVAEMVVVKAMPGAALAVGATCTTRDGAAIAGAMWDGWWMGDSHAGPDGLHLMVMLPNGREWCVDGRASNCTLPGDTVHRCWVRHGVPPDVTVDKRGTTCAAGAGSIQAGDYHGFLRAGHLVP